MYDLAILLCLVHMAFSSLILASMYKVSRLSISLFRQSHRHDL